MDALLIRPSRLVMVYCESGVWCIVYAVCVCVCVHYVCVVWRCTLTPTHDDADCQQRTQRPAASRWGVV